MFFNEIIKDLKKIDNNKYSLDTLKDIDDIINKLKIKRIEINNLCY